MQVEGDAAPPVYPPLRRAGSVTRVIDDEAPALPPKIERLKSLRSLAAAESKALTLEEQKRKTKLRRKALIKVPLIAQVIMRE